MGFDLYRHFNIYMKNTKILLEKVKNNSKNNFNIEHSVIIGIILGDGSLYKNTLNSNARLELSFGEKFCYIYWTNS